jgi:uncharacterized damage-inducible protein DinB
MIPSSAYYADFFNYVRWADLKQLDASRGLADEAYFREHGWSFGNVHKVMLHMLAAQDVWLLRFEGATPRWLFDDPSLGTRAALEPAWKDVHERFAGFLQRLTPEKLAHDLTIKRPNGETRTAPLWRLLTHALNHSTIHRGQLNSMLKLLGATPPMVDYTTWTFSEVIKS